MEGIQPKQQSDIQPFGEINQQEIDNKEKDISQEVKKIIDQLSLIDRAYFAKDRQKQIKQKIHDAIALLDQKPLDLIQNKKEKAEMLYLRGKCLDFEPEYTKQAEEFLSKSIKLMPTKTEAWDALGHVYWKKQDIEQSRKCFEGSLEQNDKNKIALRNLSMVYRMLESSPSGEKLDSEDKKKNYQHSINLAQKSVSLDMSDSQSWYVLGNAHLTNFFVNNESTKELELALKAYSFTEKYMKEPNPDLYFNRGTVFEYLERYSEAAADFQKAHTIDPALGGDKKADSIIGFVSKAYNAISNKGRIKTKRLIDMVRSIPQSLPASQGGENQENKLKIVDISQLNVGENPGLITSSKVVYNIEKSIDVPMCFLTVDFKHNFSVISIYHMSKNLLEKVRPGSEILIKNPHLVIIQLEYKGYKYNYQCIKVTELSNVFVNGQSLSSDLAQTQVISKTFT